MEQVEAIVLSRRPHGEADGIITCFTRQQGKVEFRARGIRKSTAKHAAPLAELNLLDLYYVEAHGKPLITETVLRNPFSAIKESSEKLEAARAITNTLFRALPTEFPDMVLWWQLSNYLSTLERYAEAGSATRIAPAYFLFSFLTVHGTSPELRTCAVCGADLVAADSYWFSPEHGGVVERSCRTQGEQGITITPVVRALLLTWRTLPLQEVLTQELTAETADDALRLVDYFAKWHLGERASVRFKRS